MNAAEVRPVSNNVLCDGNSCQNVYSLSNITLKNIKISQRENAIYRRSMSDYARNISAFKFADKSKCLFQMVYARRTERSDRMSYSYTGWCRKYRWRREFGHFLETEKSSSVPVWTCVNKGRVRQKNFPSRTLRFNSSVQYKNSCRLEIVLCYCSAAVDRSR